MAGREQKAREGKGNGGFAPYGYKLVEGELQIAEEEIDEIEEELTSIHTQISELKKNAITSESVYTILLYFNDIYSMSSDTEKKQLIHAFIDSIELYPECDIKQLI